MDSYSFTPLTVAVAPSSPEEREPATLALGARRARESVRDVLMWRKGLSPPAAGAHYWPATNDKRALRR